MRRWVVRKVALPQQLFYNNMVMVGARTVLSKLEFSIRQHANGDYYNCNTQNCTAIILFSLTFLNV